MKISGFILTFLLICQATASQSPVEKGLQSINRNIAEAHIGFLASDLLEGREAGTRGGQIAGEYIVACLKTLGIQSPLPDYYQPFQAKTKKKIKADSIIDVELSLKNILGVLPGEIVDEYVIVGAHYDHLGINPELKGDSIFNGADDNASGVSAVLQTARGFVESGIKPRRTVIFAFWDGEEKGLLGSKYFVDTFDNTDRIKCYMNFDMIGRNNNETKPNHVVYFYTDTHPEYGEWLKGIINQYNLSLTPDYRAWDRPIIGSDNAPFAMQDIPIIWYHTDAHPDYHQPGDHADKLNWGKLIEITQTAFLIMWKLANEYIL